MRGNGSQTAVRLRQQASVEAEVARSRLALAYRDLEEGNKELALRRSVEAAFDAGVAYGYASEAKQKNFSAETKAMLAEAQAIASEAGAQDACEGAYKAGVQYAKARNRNSDSAVQAALVDYEGVIEQIGVGRMTNPGRSRRHKRGSLTKKLKARLLR